MSSASLVDDSENKLYFVYRLYVAAFQILGVFVTCRPILVYPVLHRIIRSWYTGRWWMGCYIWYSGEGPGRAAVPPSPLLAVPNVTAHPSTASVPITVLLWWSVTLRFNVAIKGVFIATQLNSTQLNRFSWTAYSQVSRVFVYDVTTYKLSQLLFTSWVQLSWVVSL